jgi:hypothetical protein
MTDWTDIERALRDRKEFYYFPEQFISFHGYMRKYGDKPYYEVYCTLNGEQIVVACAVRNLWYLNIRRYPHEMKNKLAKLRDFIRLVADKLVECQNEDTLRNKVRKETGILV